MRPGFTIALTASVLAALAGCDGSHGMAATTAPAPLPPTVTAIVVNGRASLASVGETTQLWASASYSDGSIRGITGEAKWASSDPATLSVSAQGLVTALRFGLAYVSASYETRVGGEAVEAMPAGSIAGVRVMEDGGLMDVHHRAPGGVFATSTAYTCVAPCMLDLNTIHF